MKDLSNYRQSYERSELLESSIPDDPINLFNRWFHETETAGAGGEVNAMSVSTIGSDGFPRTRVVLLKAFTEEGFVFFTNYHSEKGRSIEANPKVCLSFFWPWTERQVIIKGTAEKVPAEVPDAYFHSRPLGSQLGAIASDQSQEIPSREFLDSKLADLEAQYKDGNVPRPEHWGGYLVRPLEVEFWQGRPNRLHDRIRYRLDGVDWRISRLSP